MNSLLTCNGQFEYWYFLMNSSVTGNGEFEYSYCYNEQFSDMHCTVWILILLYWTVYWHAMDSLNIDIVIINSLLTCNGHFEYWYCCNEQYIDMQWRVRILIFFVMNSSVTWTGQFEYWYCYNEQFSDMDWRVWIFILL